jgi:alpha-tubulin suppressor-like RCC1 family protein
MVPSLFKSQVVDLACGGFHSIAVTSAGEILSWGCGSKGQLGHGERFSKCMSPVSIITLKLILGDPTTLPKPKRIEALWKPKLFEQFMAKDKQTKRGPVESEAVRIGVSVSCGEAHTAVLICNKLYMVRYYAHALLLSLPRHASKSNPLRLISCSLETTIEDSSEFRVLVKHGPPCLSSCGNTKSSTQHSMDCHHLILMTKVAMMTAKRNTRKLGLELVLQQIELEVGTTLTLSS